MARKSPPDWAYRSVAPTEREAAEQASKKGTMRTNWHEVKGLKSWAKQQGWPTSWSRFESRFYETMLANDANFALALSQSGLRIRIPIAEHTLTAAELRRFDAYGADPQDWSRLVEDLREVRRAIDVGVVINVEDNQLDSFDSFYNWAHGRYPHLEDGADEWIGMD